MYVINTHSSSIKIRDNLLGNEVLSFLQFENELLSDFNVLSDIIQLLIESLAFNSVSYDSIMYVSSIGIEEVF